MLDVMHGRLERVAEGIYAVSAWDLPPWKVYTNHYLVVGGSGQLVLIDCGRDTHAAFLADALAQLGKGAHQIAAVVATHAHADHVGGIATLPGVPGWILPDDWDLLPAELKPRYAPALPGDGPLSDLEYIHLGWHTPGSVAVFHRPTGTLFCGDHLGFYHLPAEGFAGFGAEIRRRACQWVKLWASDPKEREEDRLSLWLEGVRRLKEYPVTVLCPGHGGVLVGEIPSFLPGGPPSGRGKEGLSRRPAMKHEVGIVRR